MKFKLISFSTVLMASLLMFNCQQVNEENMLSYGAFEEKDGTRFRLLAPKAERVYVVIFINHQDDTGQEYAMEKTPAGDWEVFIKNIEYGTIYGYRLEGPAPIDPKLILADPYTTAAITQNTYQHTAKSLLVKDDFDWEGDQPLNLDLRDAVIYEMHVRDLTAHSTSQADKPGTYLGLVDPDQKGGIAHIKNMGYNAVELLPSQDFANVEIPYMVETPAGHNTWNPYARNHWGYMTTFFFAPETYYASDGTAEPGAWNGTDGRVVNEFKTMVKEFHKAGIAVLMDVVYNHVSNYDYHPFKYIDKEKYFRLDENGDYVSISGCGNDTRTEDPDVRRLIVESVKYWMTEYHIDGFRFDLAYLIDKETCAMILAEARKINPNVIIIAEPWGGGYDPSGFSDLGWAAWNDQFRNGVKGENPNDGKGFIWGEWQGENDLSSLQRYAMGSPREFGGQYVDIAHSINYLESHDDHTMGDFIRIGNGDVAPHAEIIDRKQNALVTEDQLAYNKLAALYLLTSQGAVMIHEGQEWARSKVIADTDVPDDHVGQIDHNSYNKDNDTNYLNWAELDLNQELANHYRELIALRKANPEFRHSSPEDFKFIDLGDKVALAYVLKEKFLVALNGEKKTIEVAIPSGDWQYVHGGGGTVSGKLSLAGTSGIILSKE